MTFRSLAATAIVIGSVFATTGCDTSAVVQVEFENETGKSTEIQQALSIPHASVAAPTRFAFRLSQIYLAEGVGADNLSVGKTSVVWRAGDCPDRDHCAFVDFARDGRAVMSDVEVGGALTRPGTYRFVRLELCQSETSTPNFQWSNGLMQREIRHARCAISSTELNPPVTLEVGEVAAVKLSYDLSAAVATAPIDEFTADKAAAFIDCNDDVTTWRRSCVRMPTIQATVTKR